jgi:hypothetical protein
MNKKKNKKYNISMENFMKIKKVTLSRTNNTTIISHRGEINKYISSIITLKKKLRIVVTSTTPTFKVAN